MIILAAPCSMSFTDSGHATGYNLTYRIAKDFDVDFIALVKNISIRQSPPKNLKLIEVGPGSEDIISSSAVWPYAYYRCAKRWLRNKRISLIHHMRYFSYSPEGFNLLALLGSTKDYPFVVGPAEAPHLFLEEDYALRKGSARANVEYNAVSMLRKISDPLLRRLFERTLEKCDVLVAVDNKTKDFFSKYISPEKIVVIPLGLNCQDFRFSTPPDNHEILTLGVHIKRKGFEYLIKAMSKVVKEFPDSRLNILSDGPRRRHLEVLAKTLRLDRNVVFHGWVPKDTILSHFQNARILCHPSLSEGFCHVILEGMAAGRPVVSTDTFGSEMVEHGKTGFLVKPGDSEALAEGILALFNDFELSREMGKMARKKVEREYDWTVIARQYYDLYTDLT